MKILYIEDDEYLASVIKESLESLGHEVVVVHKISHAIEELSAWKFDRIICDGTLDRKNRGDGYRFAAQLKKEGRSVVVFTSDTRHVPEGIVAVHKLGASPSEIIRQLLA